MFFYVNCNATNQIVRCFMFGARFVDVTCNGVEWLTTWPGLVGRIQFDSLDLEWHLAQQRKIINLILDTVLCAMYLERIEENRI